MSKPAPYTENENDCWIWQKSLNRGYGRTWNGKRRVYAHRHYYEMFVGPIPDGHDLDHLCSEPACVNPEHLEPVSHVENVRRGKRPKLTIEIARDIRAVAWMLPARVVGEVYGVSYMTIYNIWHGKIWNEATDG